MRVIFFLYKKYTFLFVNFLYKTTGCQMYLIDFRSGE